MRANRRARRSKEGKIALDRKPTTKQEGQRLANTII